MTQAQRESPTLVMVNGEFHEQISVADRGLAYGDGLFESMRYNAGNIPLLDRHLARCLAGCEALHLSLDAFYLREQFSLFLSRAKSLALPLGKIKLTITRGAGGRGCYLPHKENNCSIILQLSPLADTDGKAVKLVSAKSPLIISPLLLGIKHLSRLPYVAASLGQSLRADEELLYCDEDGCLIETMHHNLFFLKEQQVITPQLKKAGVAGIARNVIENHLAKSLGLAFIAQDIKTSNLKTFEACFIANAVRVVSPVKAIEDLEFASSEHFSNINSAFDKILRAKT